MIKIYRIISIPEMRHYRQLYWLVCSLKIVVN